jgi:predicted DNA-binding transcriptional regulator YafY
MKIRLRPIEPAGKDYHESAFAGRQKPQAGELAFQTRKEQNSRVSALAHPFPPSSKRGSRVQAQRYGRPPWERMLKIRQRIQDGGWPNCVGMAADFEVSVRTLKRDIEFMRDRLQLPIEYDTRRHGFYFTKPVDPAPGLALSEAEELALVVGRKAIAGTPFARSLGPAFRKLAARLAGQETSATRLQERLSFRPLAPEKADARAFQTLTKALLARRILRFEYRNLGTMEAQLRLVQPYHLAAIDNHWYLFAFDLGRQAVRTFALARITRPELTSDRFQRPAGFNADEYLRGSFTVLKGHEDYEVVIQFDPWATDLVRRRQWHGSQDFIELPGSGSQLRLRLSSLAEVESWVLQWGVHATVVRPRLLAERVHRTAAALIARYAAEQADSPAA